MKKFVFLLLIVGQCVFSQSVTQSFKTIVDYGAIIYSSKEAALKGKESCHVAIHTMVSELGSAVLPPYGWFYIDETVVLWRNRDNITSLNQGNNGVNLVTDKPIDMFLLTNNEQEIRGFTAWYIGSGITKECAVVRIGGDSRNIGGLYVGPTGKEVHFRPRRTNGVGINVDINFQGDKKFSMMVDHTGRTLNPHFIKNYGAHVVWVNYEDIDESTFSHLHLSSFKGFWQNVNTGIKITRRKDSKQSLNTIEIDAKIWGANQFFDISGINFSKIKIIGQEQKTYSDIDKKNLFKLIGGRINFDVFIYDVGGKRGGQVDVKDIKISGLAEMSIYWRNGKPKVPNTNFKNSTFLNKKDF